MPVLNRVASSDYDNYIPAVLRLLVTYKADVEAEGYQNDHALYAAAVIESNYLSLTDIVQPPRVTPTLLKR